jgi:hypothetical protein
VAAPEYAEDFSDIETPLPTQDNAIVPEKA